MEVGRGPTLRRISPTLNVGRQPLARRLARDYLRSPESNGARRTAPLGAFEVPQAGAVVREGGTLNEFVDIATATTDALAVVC
jgi:hypothetical protein